MLEVTLSSLDSASEMRGLFRSEEVTTVVLLPSECI